MIYLFTTLRPLNSLKPDRHADKPDFEKKMKKTKWKTKILKNQLMNVAA